MIQKYVLNNVKIALLFTFIFLFGCNSNKNKNKIDIELLESGAEKYWTADYKGAIEDYEKANLQHPLSDTGYLYLGKSKLFLQDYQGAIEIFTKGITKYKNITDFYVYRGLAYKNIHNYPKAMSDFHEAIGQIEKSEVSSLQLYEGVSKDNFLKIFADKEVMDSIPDRKTVYNSIQMQYDNYLRDSTRWAGIYIPEKRTQDSTLYNFLLNLNKTRPLLEPEIRRRLHFIYSGEDIEINDRSQSALRIINLVTLPSDPEKFNLDLTCIEDTKIYYDKIGACFNIILKLNENGKRIFNRLSKVNVNKKIYVVFNKEIITAPMVNEEINSWSFHISGNLTKYRALMYSTYINNSKNLALCYLQRAAIRETMNEKTKALEDYKKAHGLLPLNTAVIKKL